MTKGKRQKWSQLLIGGAGLLAALLLLRPANAFAEERAQDDDIYMLTVGNKVLVNEHRITAETYPGVTFNPETNTVILKDADIKADPDQMKTEWDQIFSPFFAEAGKNDTKLTIRLEGDNQIAYTRPLEGEKDAWRKSTMEFHAFANVEFEGTGSLELIADGDISKGILLGADSNFCGVTKAQPTDFTMKGCEIKIDAAKNTLDNMQGILGSGDVAVTSGSTLILTSEGNQSTAFTGIQSDINTGSKKWMNVMVSDSTVRIAGTSEGMYTSVGISLSEGGNVTMKNSDVRINLAKSTGGRAFSCGEPEDGSTSGKLVIDNTYFQGQEKYHGLSTGFSEYEVKGIKTYFGGSSFATQEEVELSGLLKMKAENGKQKLFIAYPYYTFDPGEGTTVTPGDINGDSRVNIVDARLCMNHVVGKEELSGSALGAANMNGDGNVNVFDVMLIMQTATSSK